MWKNPEILHVKDILCKPEKYRCWVYWNLKIQITMNYFFNKMIVRMVSVKYDIQIKFSTRNIYIF